MRACRRARGRSRAWAGPVVLLSALVARTFAEASPALPGFTGTLSTPTAFSQAFQSGAVGVSTVGERPNGYLTYGFWETGELTLSGDRHGLRFHAKQTLRPEGPNGPALAVGAMELLGGAPSVYVVASDNLHVREGGARVRLSAGLATRGRVAPLFANMEVRISRVALLKTEWSRWLNAGVGFDPTAEFRLFIGVVRRRVALSVSYDIGL